MEDVVAMGGCIFRHNICEYLTCASIKGKWTPNWIFVFLVVNKKWIVTCGERLYYLVYIYNNVMISIHFLF